ncbi:TPA: hypothetical protein ACK3Q6_005660 [Burkholderia cepacia]|jgi:hypothetical protein|uniref:Lipoprotein n=2 Tax=Burkholderia cepacia complex TaxID=87882 RepID=A0ABD7YFG7_9BURK|nr:MULTISPECIES: hypothetical protein [Burkholderia]MBX3822792.1 hypothetical protein [Burkholderia contaminans]MBX3843217.1 hypothetical protein [Burkholderia contaminans]MBX3861120.1 hypothetical protein [Burkholderia contaminans]MBX3868801.1 hypothetical protein [Burkholderia contaminans]MBX3929797.1 hypothetical protein [Burkholderia contaminans]
MTASRAMLTSTLSCLLLGCASPSVQYTKLQPSEKAAPGAQTPTPQNPQGWQKFRFAHSSISIAQDPKSGAYSASALLVDVPTDPFYTAHGSSKIWGVKTDIGFKYKTNTQLLDTADVSMEDNRIKIIDALGSAAAAVVPLVGGGGPSAFPINIAMDPYLAATPPNDPANGVMCSDDTDRIRKCTLLKPSKDQADWTVTFTIYPAPSDAIKTTDFEASHLNTDEPSVYYSACRDIVVALKANAAPAPVHASAHEAAPSPVAKAARGKTGVVIPPMAPIAPQASASGPSIGTLQSSFRVADPNYLEAIALPAKGTVTLRNDCGAEVTSQPPGTSTTADVLAEAVKEAKAAWPATSKAAAAPAKQAGQ